MFFPLGMHGDTIMLRHRLAFVAISTSVLVLGCNNEQSNQPISQDASEASTAGETQSRTESGPVVLGLTGVFAYDGRHRSGDLRHADPHLLLWMAGPQLPEGANVRRNR